MRLGVVLTGLAVTVLTLAVSAWAARPLHVKDTFSDSVTFATGELCDLAMIRHVHGIRESDRGV
jgi:hypothetical protein